MTENETSPVEANGALFDVAKKMATAGDRWFISFARSLGRAAGRVKQETDIVASSARAAAATTSRVTAKMVNRIKPNFIVTSAAPENNTSDDLLKVVATHYAIDEDLLRSNREAFDAIELLHQACAQVRSRQVIEMEAQPSEVSAPAPTAIVVEATLVSSETRPAYEPVTERLTEPSIVAAEPVMAPAEPVFEPAAARPAEAVSESQPPIYTGPEYLQPIYVQSDYAPTESVDPESAHDESAQGESAHDESAELESAHDESAHDESAHDESAHDGSGEVESPLPESPSGSTSTDPHSRRAKKRRGHHRS